jgi:hypothetical protein
MRVQFYVGEQVAAIRARIEPVFGAMLTRTPCADFTVDDLFALSAKGRAVIGVVWQDDAPILAGAFEFRHYPQAVAVNIMALGGSSIRAAFRAFWPAFSAWCREMGAQRIEASCDDAMVRLLGRFGFGATSRNVSYVLD